MILEYTRPRCAVCGGDMTSDGSDVVITVSEPGVVTRWAHERCTAVHYVDDEPVRAGRRIRIEAAP